MVDRSALPREEVEVSRTHLVEGDRLGRGVVALVGRIARHGDAETTERQVDQPGAVDSVLAEPTPHVAHAHEPSGFIEHGGVPTRGVSVGWLR